MCSSRPSPKAWVPGAPMTKGRRKWTSQLNRPRENSPFLCSLVLFGCSRASMLPPALGGGGGVFFIQSADCSTALLWKRPHRRAQKECFSSHLGLPEPSQGDTGNSASQPSRKMAKPTTNPDVSLTVITPHSLSQRGFCRPGSNPPVGSKLP